VDWPIAAVERSWAGLRSFTPDRAPVFGLDPNCPDFYWCAGQGGAGIQTSPAISALLAAEILGVPVAAPYAGVDTAQYRPGRFF
jgi:D-arginine dehydrogenase